MTNFIICAHFISELKKDGNFSVKIESVIFDYRKDLVIIMSKSEKYSHIRVTIQISIETYVKIETI